MLADHRLLNVFPFQVPPSSQRSTDCTGIDKMCIFQRKGDGTQAADLSRTQDPSLSKAGLGQHGPETGCGLQVEPLET